MRIALLALEGSLLSAIAGLSDIFWITNQVVLGSPEHAGRFSTPPFETVIVSADEGPVWDAQGRLIPVDCSFLSAGQPDIIIATGMALDVSRMPVNSESIRKAAVWIRRRYEEGARVAGACAGGFILGEAGLLDGRRCTTTWWLYHTLQQRYPNARPVWGKALEEDERVLTSGGPLSWVALALHIIKREAGADVARLTADMAVADSQPLSQQVYAPPGFINTRHPLLMCAEEVIRYRNPGISAEGLATALNMTERTLQRKIKKLTQESPKEFITRVRIESACVLLANPVTNIREVAAECGYTEDTAFRKAFGQVMGMTPSQYRKWIEERSSLNTVSDLKLNK
ncbi:AraC family transcriptional regulator [Mangrovibacter phragmitis]|uniref:AraC family transcriptional regulator n=1 Tax=Mangrovibacter phragmitis TaxID=1691903 RepID=A0A1B7L8X7_9ENTR|nr:helix-turn-helix domain-containing protein [Mangrovibacter phragmitis]OAT78745.1 AraC family transcriptional regulator [Mangrovibacter phragmitis]